MGRDARGTSAPAAINEYTLISDVLGDNHSVPRATLHDDAGVRTRALLSEERNWEFQSTTAFWAATFFLQGSVLFTIGSIAMFPSVMLVCGEDVSSSLRLSLSDLQVVTPLTLVASLLLSLSPHQGLETDDDCQPEFMYKAWVDYSFMIGAWCFTVGNYAVYFQVINSHEKKGEIVSGSIVCDASCQAQTASLSSSPLALLAPP